MKKLYNLARGTVRVEASGVEPEILLNKLCDNNIEFWDTRSEDGFSVLFTAHSADLTEIRSCALKNGCDIKILGTRGGKTITRSAKRRYALLIGIAACIIITAVSSLFVWSISVSGNKNMSYGEVVRALKECGVEYGVFWPAISAESIENEILLKHPDVSWISLNMSNSRLEVIIHERTEKPDIVNEAEPRSIYAQKSGIITNVSVLLGKSAVNIGDTVCEGEILVNGLVDSETGDDRQVHAIADVTARTWYEISAVSPLTENKKSEKDGGSLKLSLLSGKNRINFYSDSRNKEQSCDKINKLRYISFGDSFVIPIGVDIQSTNSYEIRECEVDREETALRLQDDLMAELRYRIGSGEIVSSSFAVTECDGLLVVTLRAECMENIA
ncbi:MAG: sporulation protein YqfD [Bacillota bacterium]|nr:sporulation protein YqfD [Bacillota bacterium]